MLNLNRIYRHIFYKMNNRTNILGNLLTNETKIEIVVDNRFAGDWNGGMDGDFTEVPNPDYN